MASEYEVNPGTNPGAGLDDLAARLAEQDRYATVSAELAARADKLEAEASAYASGRVRQQFDLQPNVFSRFFSRLLGGKGPEPNVIDIRVANKLNRRASSLRDQALVDGTIHQAISIVNEAYRGNDGK
ncbi:MAG: hypothetical protein ACYCPS_00415 [Candidatus Saccharimonadales bacterium]